MKNGEFTEQHGEYGPTPKGAALCDGYVLRGHREAEINMPFVPGDRHVQRPPTALTHVDERLVLPRVGQQPEPPYTPAGRLDLWAALPTHGSSSCVPCSRRSLILTRPAAPPASRPRVPAALEAAAALDIVPVRPWTVGIPVVLVDVRRKAAELVSITLGVNPQPLRAAPVQLSRRETTS